MTIYQITTIAISLLAVFGSVVGVFIKTRFDLIRFQTKTEHDMVELRSLIAVNKDNAEKIRKENREDHREMFKKMDTLIKKVS